MYPLAVTTCMSFSCGQAASALRISGAYPPLGTRLE